MAFDTCRDVPKAAMGPQARADRDTRQVRARQHHTAPWHTFTCRSTGSWRSGVTWWKPLATPPCR